MAISSSSRHATQVWPRDSWKRLIVELNRRWGTRCVAVAPPGDPYGLKALEQETNGLLTVAAPSSLGFLAAMLRRADALICDCSGPRHFGVSQGTPTLAIIGGSRRDVWRYPSKLHREVHLDLPCQPCGARSCRLGGVPCMKRMPVELVLDAFADLRRATHPDPERGARGNVAPTLKPLGRPLRANPGPDTRPGP
ncbi:hypothetical protein BH24PSE2_BH24PSE2_08380 [soil metagenome]